jgi:chromosome segregation ATPase
MHGARWGWIALIAAISVLFVASSQDQSSNNKVASLLRQELKNTMSERDRLETEATDAHQAAEQLSGWAVAIDQELTKAQQELRALRAERDKLRKEMTGVSQDRNQLQQTVASLQIERSQTRRNVDQLRLGLQQLLTQTDTVASQLAGPAPGFAQTTYEETPLISLPPAKKPASHDGTYYADEPLNDNQ